jgi:hypothetical protein
VEERLLAASHGLAVLYQSFDLISNRLGEVVEDGVGHELEVEFGIINHIVLPLSSLLEALGGRQEWFEELVDFAIHLLLGQLVSYFFHVGLNSL